MEIYLNKKLNYPNGYEVFVKNEFGDVIIAKIWEDEINSNYVYLLSSGLFVFGEFLNESSFSFCKLYFIFFPNLYEIDYGFAFFSVFHLIILSLFYLMLIIMIL